MTRAESVKLLKPLITPSPLEVMLTNRSHDASTELRRTNERSQLGWTTTQRVSSRREKAQLHSALRTGKSLLTSVLPERA